MAENIKKILIRGTNWIGDAVLTTPAIRAVRQAFPDAHISLLAKPWVAEIFKGSPDINEIIIYEDRFSGLTGRFKLSKLLRSRGFDSAILLQNAFDAALITWLAGIPERIGYSRDCRQWLLTNPVPVNKDTLRLHHVHYYLNMLKQSLNIEPDSTEPLIHLDEDEVLNARALLKQALTLTPENPLIGINPGATFGSAKRWGTERFAELIHRIVNELNGRVVLFGSKPEAGIAREIINQIPEHRAQNTDYGLRTTDYPDTVVSPYGAGRQSVLNLAGKTSLRELSALISECDLLVSNDSGPMHIASALFIPVVGIFGSTDSETTCPYGPGHRIVSKDIACSPCLKRQCPEKHLECMTGITTEDVFNALKELLSEKKAVFLDRDGTLNEDVGYLSSFSDLKIFEGVKENLERLKKAGFKLIGITNQSGIARGLISEDFVNACNAYVQENLDIDDFYYCPHHPDSNCMCRKPKPMLLRKAQLKHNINLKTSYVIGDKDLDALLAKAVGAKGILVLTGTEKESEHADFIAKDLSEAVDWILKQES